MFTHNAQCHIWRKPNTSYQHKRIMPTINLGGGALMIWACFVATGPCSHWVDRELLWQLKLASIWVIKQTMIPNTAENLQQKKPDMASNQSKSRSEPDLKCYITRAVQKQVFMKQTSTNLRNFVKQSGPEFLNNYGRSGKSHAESYSALLLVIFIEAAGPQGELQRVLNTFSLLWLHFSLINNHKMEGESFLYALEVDQIICSISWYVETWNWKKLDFIFFHWLTRSWCCIIWMR